MDHTFHLTRMSTNSKTGPIPVSTSSRSTCPDCAFKGNGCYAEGGPLRLHWDKVSRAERGGSVEELAAAIHKLPKRQLWRWAQAGDLPGSNGLIDAPALALLVEANTGRKGFGFTHYDASIPANAAALKHANDNGFTMNLSANNVDHADELLALDVGPVVVVLPIEATKSFTTKAGNHVSVCPASIRDDVQCATCGICANATRKAIIGFPAHGSGAHKAQSVAVQVELFS